MAAGTIGELNKFNTKFWHGSPTLLHRGTDWFLATLPAANKLPDEA